MNEGFVLDLNSPNSRPIIWYGGKPTLYLRNFLDSVEKASNIFIGKLADLTLNETVLTRLQ